MMYPHEGLIERIELLQAQVGAGALCDLLVDLRRALQADMVVIGDLVARVDVLQRELMRVLPDAD